MNASKKYTKLTDIEHCLKRPARYLGACVDQTSDDYILSKEDNQFIIKSLNYNPALLKMFDEVVTNSADESKRKGSKLNSIAVTVNQLSGEFRVEDNGGIPVQMHDEHHIWIPDMIFGELRSGSNFDDDEEQALAGQNGEGSSLVNIFSTMFRVETADGEKFFSILYENNLSIKHEPTIMLSGKHFTSVSWLPDYERLGTVLSDDTMLLIEKRMHELAACNPKLKISYNGTKISYKSFSDYATMYVHQDTIVDNQKDWNITIAPSVYGFEHVSFVNGTASKVGGTHVEYVLKQIIQSVRDYLKTKHKVDVKPSDIKNQLMLFIDATIINPRYDSQTKDNLVTLPSDYKTHLYEVSKSCVSELCSSSIIQTILDWIAAKERKDDLLELRREQKKQKSKVVDSYIHANHKMRQRCTLFLVEGASALSHFLSVCNRDIHGAFPLKGKPMNVRDCKPVDIVKNVEVASILSIMGLKFGELAENLNYGHIAIMTDADTDGASIQGLLTNLFYYWPEMYKSGKISIILAPIIIARKGTKVKRYYHLDEYEADQGKLEGWTTKYYKGLGSMDKEEYSLLIHSPKSLVVDLDVDAAHMLEVVYGKSAELRKDWLI